MLKILITLLILPVFVLGGLLFAWQDEALQAYLLDWLGRAPGMDGIRFHGFAGEPWHRLRLQQLELLDREGRWLNLEEAEATLSWPDLLRGWIVLKDVQAKRVQALRPPVSDSATPHSPNPSNLPNPPDTAASSPLFSYRVSRIVLENTRVAQLELGEPLLRALPAAWHPLVGALPAEGGVTIDLARERVEIEDFFAETPWMTVTGRLGIDLGAQAVQGSFEAGIPEIAPFFVPWTDTPPTGAMHVNVTLAGPLLAPRTGLILESDRLARSGQQAREVVIHATIHPPRSGPQAIPIEAEARGTGLEGLPDPWTGLLAGAFTTRIQGVLKPDEGIEAQSWHWASPRLTWNSVGALNWRERTIALQTVGQLPDLGMFSEQVGRKLTGAATVHGQIRGPWSAPEMTWRAESETVRVEEQPIQKILVQGDLKDFDHHPSGSLETHLVQPQGVLTVNTRYRLENDARLVLEGLQVSAPKTRLSGHLVGEWRRGLRLSGALKGEIADLAALKPWHGQELGGVVSLDLALKQGEDGIPQGELHARVRNLSGRFGRMEGMRIEARAGLERGGVPRVEATVGLDRWSRDEWRVEKVQGRATGSLEQLQFSGEGQGRLRWPYSFATKGSLRRKGESWSLNLQELTGRLDKEPVKLIAPLTVTGSARGVEIAPWEGRVGEAVVTGSWRREGRQVAGKGRVQGDLALLHRLGIWPLRGEAKAEMEVSGHEDRPQVQVHATLVKGRLLTEGMKPLPPLHVTLNGQAQEGQNPRIELQARGLTPEETRGFLVLPMRLYARAPWLTLDRSGVLSGEMRTGIHLEELGRWLGWDERQRLEGVLKVDLIAGGSLEQPTMQGSATLEKGRLELADTGSTLQEIRLRIKAEGESLVLESLSATDGEKGGIQAEGRLQLDAGRQFPLEGQVRFVQAVVLRREDATAQVSGPLRIAGTLAAPRVQGELTLHRAEFHPAASGAGEIRVVELDEPHAGAGAGGATGETLPWPAVELDLAVSIPGRAMLRGHGLDSEWMGTLRVTGAASEPRVVGQLQVKRGTLDLLERRLQLTSGAVTLDGSWPPDPWIEMASTLRRREVVTHVGLEGRIQHPRVTLTSEPAMSEEEILSHLLFDRATDSITPGQALKLAWALKNMQEDGPGFLGRVQRELGIDRLDVSGDSAKTGTVSAGKYLTDDIYLEMEKGLKSDSGRINVEVEMTPQLFLKSGVDAKSNADVGVQWKMDY
ncbi:MAG: translocation/assembly module TamB [Magnetococcales bacterium]|nr:translocation/assembly module TamB [Magnetococcales bacterium]